MQVIDSNGNIFGGGIEITGPDGKPKTTGGGGGSPTGPAGGDLSGSYPNPGVAWTNGIPTYDLQYYPLSLNPAGYLTSAALSGYLTAATAASTYYPIPTGTASQYIKGDGTFAAFPSIPTVTPSALTKTDDTNVTLTLGGTPSTSLLQSVSLTLGWTGTLADSRIASASTWNAKQNALVSGTSIKTINSTSLLGSGDVAVQATLVSGTNIKTINGNSILGSGDLTVSGSNIYNADGTLTAARTLTQGGFDLTIAGTTSSRFFSNGNVGIGTTTDAGFKLNVNGTARVQSGLTISGQTANNYLTIGTGTGNAFFVWSAYFLGVNGVKFRAEGLIGDPSAAATSTRASAAIDSRGYLVTDSIGIGTTTSAINASAIAQINSTTKGFLPPRMTNAQMLAIATPAAGLVVYDTTNNKHCGYNGTAWQNFY